MHQQAAKKLLIRCIVLAGAAGSQLGRLGPRARRVAGRLFRQVPMTEMLNADGPTWPYNMRVTRERDSL